MKPYREGATKQGRNRIATMIVSLFLFALVAAPAYAKNPQEHVGAQSVAYTDCLLSLALADEEAAAKALVLECGHKPDKPIDEFIKETLSSLPADPYAPVMEQIAPHRHLYNAEQLSYFEAIDRIVKEASSYEDALSRLTKLEDQAVAKLGRGESDLKVLGALSAARSVFEYIMNHPADVSARGFWRTLGKALSVVAAVVVGVAVAGPVGGAIAGWAMLAAYSLAPMDRSASSAPMQDIERFGVTC